MVKQKMRCIAGLGSKVISWNGADFPSARDFSLQIFVKQQPNTADQELCSGELSLQTFDSNKSDRH
jgi:hypothetical protein